MAVVVDVDVDVVVDVVVVVGSQLGEEDAVMLSPPARAVVVSWVGEVAADDSEWSNQLVEGNQPCVEVDDSYWSNKLVTGRVPCDVAVKSDLGVSRRLVTCNGSGVVVDDKSSCNKPVTWSGINFALEDLVWTLVTGSGPRVDNEEPTCWSSRLCTGSGGSWVVKVDDSESARSNTFMNGSSVVVEDSDWRNKFMNDTSVVVDA